MPPPLPYDAMRSVWTDTAAPAMATAPLAGHADCDVAIVGAGITGLSAALHLAERGLRACVLEARDPGWGASGRNGGQVIPGIKHDPDEILARHGRERGEPLLHMVGTAADTVFDLIDRYGLDCHPVRGVWMPARQSRRRHVRHHRLGRGPARQLHAQRARRIGASLLQHEPPALE
ncbi:FAD-binding oxidoreductase, partial [Bordetella bronchiseptica]|uniref:NAD(P)/FAD-dependent oxidoreductase n=1 Tax=Bordetella bronchiseptica TaxID=518 RepID=UPI003EDBC22E